MVAVAPSAPKPHVPQGSRTAKPAASGGDFSRILEKAAEVNRPAPEAESAPEDQAPEAKPEAATHPEDQAPAQTGEKKTDDQEQDQEKAKETRPAGIKDAGAPAMVAPQPIVPLSPAAPAKASPAPDQVTAAAGALLAATTGKPAILPAPVPGTGTAPVAGKAAAVLAPVPGAEGLPSPPATGKAEEGHPQTKDGKTEATAADQLPADLKLDLEQLQPKAGERAPEKTNNSTDLLSFRELMHPDLKTEVSPEPMLDQLQQAMNAALLDESALIPQVVRGLATLVSGGTSEMRLQLQPDDLGEIEVRVRTSEGVVRGEMMVQNPEVKQLLDQHLDRLRNALHQQGLDLRGFDIGLAPDGRFAQPDRSGHGFQPQGGERRQAAATNTLPEAPALAPRGSLAVDYLA